MRASRRAAPWPEAPGRGQQGVASTMNDTTREAGSAIDIALMGSIHVSHCPPSCPPP
ncbi:hypothetical protein ACH3Y9_14130 [Streptomyces sp. WSLK1-5]|uniref:hypothetical protein n=1 Tax=unclassified Streptomyces TaxID=2593676 RepID=UPI0037BDDCF2